MVREFDGFEDVDLYLWAGRVQHNARASVLRAPSAIDQPATHRACVPAALKIAQLIVVDPAGDQCSIGNQSMVCIQSQIVSPIFVFRSRFLWSVRVS